MNKNMRIWIIGICVALVIIVAVAAAAMNRNSGNPGSSASSEGMDQQTNIADNTDSGVINSSTPESSTAEIHSGHGNHDDHMANSGDPLSRYLTEQDSIMMSMMDEMVIREKTGNASLDFLKGMIPHHESAIKMSESYLEHGGENETLKKMAQDIITAQKEELVQMNDLVKEYEKDGQKDQKKEDAYLEKYGKMFSDDSMSHHIDASNVDNVDQAFAEGMIMHHQMAVDMAKDILEYTDYDEIRDLAQNIIDLQEKEIQEMQKAVEQ